MNCVFYCFPDTGGIVTMCLFIVTIIIAFREVGKLWRSQKQSYLSTLSWAMGVSLFGCINYIGVAYFGQIVILRYLLLAMIGSLSVQAKTLSTSKIRLSSAILKNKLHRDHPSCRANNNALILGE